MNAKSICLHVRWARLVILAVFLISLGVSLRPNVRIAYADTSISTSARIRAPANRSQGPCISADKNGPCFSLADLETYSPPPPKPRAWESKPPVWGEYPAALSTVPVPHRAYVTETVTYLAEHEIRHGDRARPYVALTFDCEFGTGSTKRILHTLRERDVKATFFVLGRYAYRNPEIIQEMVNDGHELGNHSFYHPRFTQVTPTTAAQEITFTEAAIDWAVGRHVPMRFLRFPYGARNNAIRLHAAAMGYQSAFWDIDPRGWDPEREAEDVVEYVRRTAHAGGIVIMHCGSWDDANALDAAIEAIQEMGLNPSPLSGAISDRDRTVLDSGP